jgi:serine/threonine protein kinase
MLNGLREVHSHKLLHLDIKPSNIYLRTDGTPVLLDFGAARQTLMTGQPYLKPMYTPGFASPEQYGDRESLGPWSDIYSVGASLYACVVGTAPPRADDRAKKDTLTPVSRTHSGRYSAQLLETIDWCLALDPLARPQSVYSLQKTLMRKQAGDAMPATWFTDIGTRLKSFIGRA